MVGRRNPKRRVGVGKPIRQAGRWPRRMCPALHRQANGPRLLRRWRQGPAGPPQNSRTPTLRPRRPALPKDNARSSSAIPALRAVLKAVVHPQHLVLEVLSVAGDGIEEFSFVDIPLLLKGAGQEAFAACALALNLQTNVEQIPQPSSRLRATCYPKFGLAGAKVAVVAAPQEKLRQALQEAVAASGELPHSPLGGPWALDAPINYGSYLFNFHGISLETVDNWITLLKSLGMNQLDVYGSGTVRYGDCRPNPKYFPEGRKTLKGRDR